MDGLDVDDATTTDYGEKHFDRAGRVIEEEGVGGRSRSSSTTPAATTTPRAAAPCLAIDAAEGLEMAGAEYPGAGGNPESALRLERQRMKRKMLQMQVEMEQLLQREKFNKF